MFATKLAGIFLIFLGVAEVQSSVTKFYDDACANSSFPSTVKAFPNVLLHMGFENLTVTPLTTNVPKTKPLAQRLVNVKQLKSGKCGHAVNLTNGHIEITPTKANERFRDVSIALWVNMDHVIGKQTLVRLLGRGLARERARFTVEVHNGGVRWGLWRGRKKIFQIQSRQGIKVPRHYWTHITAVLNTRSDKALIYINGTRYAREGVRSNLIGYWPVTWLRRVEIGSPAARRRLRGAVDELYVRRRSIKPLHPTAPFEFIKHLKSGTRKQVTFSSEARQNKAPVQEHKLRCYVCKAFNQSKPREYCARHATKTVCQGVTPLKCIEHSGIDNGGTFFIRDCKEETFCEARSCTGDLCTMKCCERDFCNQASQKGSPMSLWVLTLMVLFVMKIS